MNAIPLSEQIAAAARDMEGEHDEGPCLDAIREAEVVHSPDLAHDGRWPAWASRVLERTQVRSMMCFRLFTHEENLGGTQHALQAVDAFDEVDRDHGLALAAHAAIAIAAAQEIEHLKGRWTAAPSSVKPKASSWSGSTWTPSVPSRC